MKRLGLFMTVIMILCITVNAQKQSNRTLVAYFSATGTTEKAAKQVAEVTGGASTKYNLQRNIPPPTWTGTTNPRAAVWKWQTPCHVPHCVPSPKNLAAYDTIYIGSPFGGTWLQESSTVL